MACSPAVAMHLMSLSVAKHWPWSPIFSPRRAKSHRVWGLVNTVAAVWVQLVFLPRSAALLLSCDLECCCGAGFHLTSSLIICNSSVSLACADPFEIPNSFTASLMVICQLACTNSFTFKIVVAFTEVEGLPLQGLSLSSSCLLLKLLYQSYTAVFLRAYPHKQFTRSQVFLKHSCLDVTWTSCWLLARSETFHQTAWKYLHSDSCGTWITGSNMQPLKGYRQHTLQHLCCIITYLTMRPQFWELLDTAT